MKRIVTIAIAVLFVLISAGTPAPAHAQTDPTTNTTNSACDSWFVGSAGCALPALIKATSGSLNKQAGDVGTATFSMVQFIATAMGLCDASATSPDCPKSLSFQNSAVAGLSQTTLALYENPPARTSLYLADLGRTLGFRPRVEAQGIGFSGLSVLLDLWKAFRNIAYAMLAGVMIVIGFMVMFRKKIDPKTVVTVQNAIPRIVIALLLITFSYAIVGLMIDLMYLSIVLMVSVIAGASESLGKFTSFATSVDIGIFPPRFNVGSTSQTTQQITSRLFNGGIGGLFRFFTGSGINAFDDIVAMMTGGFDPITSAKWIIYPGLIGGLVGSGKGFFLGLISAPVLLAVIILIVLLFGFIRLLFMLIDAYINIIISLLTAPFQLMMEAIPGSNAFNGWFRNLLSKILVFPVTAFLLVISAILTSQETATKIWTPPMLSTGGGVSGMAGIIGLGMLLIIPTVVAGIQKSLKAEPMIPGGVGPIFGPITSGFGQLFSLAYQASFVASAVRHKPDTRSAFQVGKEGTEKGLGGLTGGGGH